MTQSTPISSGLDFASSQRTENPQMSPATEAAELPRAPILEDIDPAIAVLGEIAQWRRMLAGAQPHLVRIITNNIATLQAELETLLHPDRAVMAPVTDESAPVPRDLSQLDPNVREAVEYVLAIKDAERAEAERQAADAARIAYEEAVTAPRHAALRAPLMGHLASRAGENFRLRAPQRVTRLVSTPEARHTVAVNATRMEEARIAAAANHLGGPVEYAAPIPIAGIGASAPRAVITGVHMP